MDSVGLGPVTRLPEGRVTGTGPVPKFGPGASLIYIYFFGYLDFNLNNILGLFLLDSSRIRFFRRANRNDDGFGETWLPCEPILFPRLSRLEKIRRKKEIKKLNDNFEII